MARQHGGDSEPENLALACHYCNQHKGPNLAGVDPETRAVVRLFHPRRDAWNEHFRRENVRIVGLTAVGRATAQLLGFNHDRPLELRGAVESPGQR